MRKGTYRHTRPWLKLYSSKWLGGSIRIEMNSAQRGVWADLLCLANVSPFPGIICASARLPFPHEYLAATLRIPLKLLESTLDLCQKEGRLREDGDGITITNWQYYQAPPEKVKKDEGTQGEFEDPEMLTPEYLERQAAYDASQLDDIRDQLSPERIAAAEKWLAEHPES